MEVQEEINSYPYVQKLLGISKQSLNNLVKKYNIQKVYIGKRPRLTDEGIVELKKHIRSLKETKPKVEGCKLGSDEFKKKIAQALTKNFWKVSVLEPESGRFIVKYCSLSQKMAKDILKELVAKNVIARASRHNNDRKYYYS